MEQHGQKGTLRLAPDTDFFQPTSESSKLSGSYLVALQ